MRRLASPSAEQSGNLVERRFILDRRRQVLLECRALSPFSGEPSGLGPAIYVHNTNTDDGVSIGAIPFRHQLDHRCCGSRCKCKVAWQA